MNFFEDMGYAPSPEYSIDRIDNSGDYEPRNCRWANMKTQCRNRNTNIKFTYKGQTKTASEWIEITNIAHSTFWNRVRRGWKIKDIIEKPVGKRKVMPCG